MKKLILLFITLVSSVSAFAECGSPDFLKAEFKAVSNGESEVYFTLWRHGSDVAMERPNGVVEAWNRARDGRLHKISYFNEYQQGIEYEANAPSEDDAEQWELKSQLVSNDFLEQMSQVSAMGNTCETVEAYELAEAGMDIQLKWNAFYKLPVDMHQDGDNKTYRLMLEKLTTDESLVKAQFEKWQSFKTTDFADIGDSEDDPFLKKMIRLGFVEHHDH